MQQFSGNREVDKLIMYNLTDEDLQNFCQTNKYVEKLCKDDKFWMNRTLQKYSFLIPYEYKKDGIRFITENYLGNNNWRYYYTWLTGMKNNPGEAFLVALTHNRKDVYDVLVNEVLNDRNLRKGPISFPTELFYIKPVAYRFIENSLNNIKGDQGGGFIISPPYSLLDYFAMLKYSQISKANVLVDIIQFIIEYYKINKDNQDYSELIDDPFIINAMKIPDIMLTNKQRNLLNSDQTKQQLNDQKNQFDALTDFILQHQ